MVRNYWFKRDCNLCANPQMQVVGDEFGPAGILVFEEIVALAKLGDPEGICRARYSVLGMRAFLKNAKKTKEIVNFLEVAGLISFVDVDRQGFVAEVVSYSLWNPGNDATNAERQARLRQRRNGGVTARNGKRNGESNGPAVTEPVTRDRDRDREREVDNTPTGSKTSIVVAEVRQVFDAWVSATDRDPKRTVLNEQRQKKIAGALKSYPVADLLAAVENIGASKDARDGYGRGTRFDDIEHAIGTAERIERWRDARPPRGPERWADLAERWDEEDAA